MAFDLDNLRGHVGEVLRETRTFTDPWKIPGVTITGEVLRGDHPDWKQHLLDLLAARPEAQRQRRVVNERVYSGLAPKGFRQKKAVSEGEAHNQMLERLSEDETLQIEIFNLREQKPGIAAILLKKLAVNRETEFGHRGKTFDLTTAEGRAAFLDHETWEFEEDGEKKELSIPIYKTGAVADKFGEKERNDLGGWNWGDAVAKMVLNESEDLAAFVEERKAEVLDRSRGISNGPTEIG